MMAWLVRLCVLLTCLHLRVHASFHDQRQTGDTNYHVDLEDVLVVALLDDFGGDYDYTYDYSDLTVKPEHDDATTAQPSYSPTDSNFSTSSSVAPNVSTEPTSIATGIFNSTTSPITTASPNTFIVLGGENSVTLTNEGKQNLTTGPNKQPLIIPEHPLNTQNFQIPVVVVTEANKRKKGYISSSSLRRKQPNVPADTESLPKRSCLQGFVLDDKNRCKKINRKQLLDTRNRPPLPFGLHFAQRPSKLATGEGGL